MSTDTVNLARQIATELRGDLHASDLRPGLVSGCNLNPAYRLDAGCCILDAVLDSGYWYWTRSRPQPRNLRPGQRLGARWIVRRSRCARWQRWGQGWGGCRRGTRMRTQECWTVVEYTDVEGDLPPSSRSRFSQCRCQHVLHPRRLQAAASLGSTVTVRVEDPASARPGLLLPCALASPPDSIFVPDL